MAKCASTGAARSPAIGRSTCAVTKWIDGGALVVVGMDGARLIGALLTSERAQASAPPVVAMLKAWPGSADAYVYGPVCVDQAARGLGVLEAMYAHAVALLPGREAVLFIKANNTRSLQAHARLGMRQVANFTLGRTGVHRSECAEVEISFVNELPAVGSTPGCQDMGGGAEQRGSGRCDLSFP